jgi:hypothetical protein
MSTGISALVPKECIPRRPRFFQYRSRLPLGNVFSFAYRVVLDQAFSSSTRTNPFSNSTMSLYSIGSRPPESIPGLERAPVPIPPMRGPASRGVSGTRSRGSGEGRFRVRNTCRLVLVAGDHRDNTSSIGQRATLVCIASNYVPNLAAMLLDLESSPSVPG